MATEHQINAKAIECRHEFLHHLTLPMPYVRTCGGRHVADSDPKTSGCKSRVISQSLQPSGLLTAITVIIRNAVILQITIGLILTAIEHNEANRTLPKSIIEMGLFGREIILESGGERSTCLMVATCIIHRLLGSEQTHALIHKSLKNTLLIFHSRDHIPIEDHEILLRMLPCRQ